MASEVGIVFENTEKAKVQQTQQEHLIWPQQGLMGVWVMGKNNLTLTGQSSVIQS